MTRRILVLFPDEWDRATARDPRYAGEVEFLHEGFDLFSFPEEIGSGLPVSNPYTYGPTPAPGGGMPDNLCSAHLSIGEAF